MMAEIEAVYFRNGRHNLPPEKRREMGKVCRERVVSELSIEKLLQRTEQVLDQV